MHSVPADEYVFILNTVDWVLGDHMREEWDSDYFLSAYDMVTRTNRNDRTLEENFLIVQRVLDEIGRHIERPIKKEPQ